MTEFPHGALYPIEAIPRITPEHAEEVIRLIDKDSGYEVSPAIIIAVWIGSHVKYLVNDQQVMDTIHNLEKAKGDEQ